ncbi:MAG: alpha/beta hydrolase family protein [Alphaproteobacteria bacterium]
MTTKLKFWGSQGHYLSARLDMPDEALNDGKPLAYALFAHCFTCGKDLVPANRVVQALNDDGIAVMRFDFTGINESQGKFEDTNFTSNVADIIAAADYMRKTMDAPSLMIGHSLGGTATLVAAAQVEEVKAVATIGAPSNTTNVMKQFGCDIETIEREGAAEVKLAGRPFTIKKQFLDDIKSQDIKAAVQGLKKPLLICHSPIDDTVPIDHAADIYSWAMHPKSFVSLNTHDHLLFADGAAEYVARTVAAWASAYLPQK